MLESIAHGCSMPVCYVCLEEGAQSVCLCKEAGLHIDCERRLIEKGNSKCAVCHTKYERAVLKSKLRLVTSPSESIVVFIMVPMLIILGVVIVVLGVTEFAFGDGVLAVTFIGGMLLILLSIATLITILKCERIETVEYA